MTIAVGVGDIGLGTIFEKFLELSARIRVV